MNGLLAFNSANDLVFRQLNKELEAKMQAIALQQGLISAENPTLDSNILLQIFSPIINSQKVMFCQFDNTYSSFQCDNGLNFAFGDLLGHQFIKIGQYPVEQLKRHLEVSIAFARLLFGPNLFASRLSVEQNEIFSKSILYYEELYDQDQSVLVEALPYLTINADLKRGVENSLAQGLERLLQIDHQRTHVLIFIRRKFICMQSAKHALALSPADMLFLLLLLSALEHNSKKENKNVNNRSLAVFLQGDSQHSHSGCIPCIAHFTRLEKGLTLIQLIEYAPLQVASSMYDTFFVLQKIIGVQMQGDVDGIKPAFDNVEIYVKQTLDALKRVKIRGDHLEASQKKFVTKWENLRKLYNEYIRCYDRELLVRIESNLLPFVEDLKQLFTLACCDSSGIATDQLDEVAAAVEGSMLEFSEFLAVKADRNLTVGSFLEEFPGLIHFIYIDRSTGMMIAPDFKSDNIIPKDYLWGMVEFARSYLKIGQTTVVWKDKALNYSYFLWFEDQATGTMKPADLQQHFINQTTAGSTWKAQHEPGILASDYYQALIEMCFPKIPVTKIKCCELFCIHLGLVPTGCAIEHSRRLVATIADVVGGDYV